MRFTVRLTHSQARGIRGGYECEAHSQDLSFGHEAHSQARGIRGSYECEAHSQVISFRHKAHSQSS